MLRWIFLLLIAALVAFAGYVAMQPATFTVSRTALIDASPQAVYPHIDNFRKWQAWSPWASRDPDMESRYSGPESGTGAEFAWHGNDDVGKGSMRIIEAIEHDRVEIALKFE